MPWPERVPPSTTCQPLEPIPEVTPSSNPLSTRVLTFWTMGDSVSRHRRALLSRRACSISSARVLNC